MPRKLSFFTKVTKNKKQQKKSCDKYREFSHGQKAIASETYNFNSLQCNRYHCDKRLLFLWVYIIVLETQYDHFFLCICKFLDACSLEFTFFLLTGSLPVFTTEVVAAVQRVQACKQFQIFQGGKLFKAFLYSTNTLNSSFLFLIMCTNSLIFVFFLSN